MKSLRAFHAGNSVDIRLRALLQNAEILHQKSLYLQSKRALKLAKKLALKHERWTILVNISNWQKKLIEKDNYSGQDDNSIQYILKEDRKVSRMIENYFEFWAIKSRFFSLMYKQGQARSEVDKMRFKSILSTPFMRSEKKALSVDAKYLYNHIYSAYYFSINHFENCYKHLVKNEHIIDTNPAVFEEEPNAYFAVLTNIIYVGTRLKKFQKVDVFLKKLYACAEQLNKTKNLDIKLKLFGSVNSLELHMYIQRAMFEKAYDLIPKIEHGLKRYKDHLSPIRKADFLYNMAVGCFSLQYFSESNRFINNLLNTKGLDESEDIYAFAQLLKVILHYELGHLDLLPYITKSSYRCLRKKGRYYETERTVLNALKKIATKPEDTETIFQNLISQLERLDERIALDHFDFINYAKSKLTGISFAQQLQRHA